MLHENCFVDYGRKTSSIFDVRSFHHKFYFTLFLFMFLLLVILLFLISCFLSDLSIMISHLILFIVRNSPSTLLLLCRLPTLSSQFYTASLILFSLYFYNPPVYFPSFHSFKLLQLISNIDIVPFFLSDCSSK